MANVIKLKRGSGSDPTANDLVVGEVAVRTDTGKLFTKKDNGTIAEISGAGGSDIFINTLSSSSGSGGGSATFNGTATRFTLSNPPDVSAQQLLVSVNGVIQKPNAGTSPSTGFAVDGNDIIFAAAPETGASFFIVTYGTIGLGIPADNSVTTGKIADGTIVNADVNASAAIAGSKINPNFGSQDISTTGNLTLYGTNPTISFTDSNEDSDFRLFINAGKFKIQDASNSNADRFTVFTDGHIDIPGNLNCADGLDVTGEITSTSHLDMPDNAKIKLGTGDDIEIYHDGTDSYLDNSTGITRIRNTGSNGSQIQLLSNNGGIKIQGTTAEQSIIANSNGSVDLYYNNVKKFETTSNGIEVTGTGYNTVKLTSQNNQELYSYHDSNGVGWATGTTTSFGELIYLNEGSSKVAIYAANEKTAEFNGNGSVELYYDNSSKFETSSSGVSVTGNIVVSGTVDGVDIAALNTSFSSLNTAVSGLSSGSAVLTNGVTATTQGASDNTTKVATTAYVTTAISNLINGAPSALDTLNELAAAMNDDAAFSATVTNSLATKMPLAGGTFTGDVTFNGANYNVLWDKSDNALEFADNAKAVFGAGSDLQIYHDSGSANSFIKETGAGSLIINANDFFVQNVASETMIKGASDGAVELYYDNGKKFETRSDGVKLSQGHFYADDSSQIRLGDSQDLKLLHDGTHSRITNTTGTLVLQSNVFSLTNFAGNSNRISANSSGAVFLYHNDSAKLETTSDGITTQGTILHKGAEGGESQIRMEADEGDDLADRWRLVAKTDGTFHLQNLASSTYETNISASGNGNVELYHNNTKRLETTSSGVSVTGNFGMSGAFNGNLVPDSDSSRNLGANGTRWANVYADTLYGDGSNLTGISAGTSLSGSTNNTICTVTGSNAIQGESNLTFDGSTLLVTDAKLRISSATPTIDLMDSSANPDYSISNNNGVFRIRDLTNLTNPFLISSSQITVNEHLLPSSNNNYDLGGSSYRWRNIYTADLQLSNEGSSNDVDGTWGSYTIQEGAEDLFLVNKRNGKKYKFNLTEVS